MSFLLSLHSLCLWAGTMTTSWLEEFSADSFWWDTCQTNSFWFRIPHDVVMSQCDLSSWPLASQRWLSQPGSQSSVLGSHFHLGMPSNSFTVCWRYWKLHQYFPVHQELYLVISLPLHRISKVPITIPMAPGTGERWRRGGWSGRAQ